MKGGTESILMAIKSYRDRAREEFGITDPEVILPTTAHPAFEKAGHYFQVKMIRVGVNEESMIPDPKDFEKLITKNTIAFVCSAPQYPHGIPSPT
jgi:sphinganine-1-phosphate aldolase